MEEKGRSGGLEEKGWRRLKENEQEEDNEEDWI